MLRLRLLVGLALGANTQAFVILPRHPLPPPSCARGRSSSQVPARDGDGAGDGPTRCYRYAKGRRGTPALAGFTMRASRSGGDVRIEGVDGETRRVRRTRRSNLHVMQRVGMQAAAAVVVAQPGVDVDVDVEEMSELYEEGDTLLDMSETSEMSEVSEKTELQLSEQAKEEGDVASRVSSGAYYDKHTKIYMPIDGVIVKKTYGFWTWQAFGFLFVQHFVRNLIRKGGDLKKVQMGEINWDHVVTEPEHLKELKAYCCEVCGYTLYPARGRHEHFFDSVDDFKCPECDAPRSAFYDANDPDDPHNQEEGEEGGEGGKAGVDASAGSSDEGGATPSAAPGGAPTSVGDAKPTAASTPAASTPASPGEAPSEPSQKGSAERSSASSSSADEREEDDGDDLLDF